VVDTIDPGPLDALDTTDAIDLDSNASVASPTSATTTDAEVEESAATPSRTQSTEDSEIPNADIESSRIDLSALLPTLESSKEKDGTAGSRNTTSNSELAELLRLTNDVASLDPFSLSSFESETYQRSLDSLADRWDKDDQLTDAPLIAIDTMVGSSVGLSSGFTVGYMIWLLRGGTLMGSVLSSLPAWRLVDPLPVLAELDDDLDDDNESLESLVSKDDPTPPTPDVNDESHAAHP